MSGYSREIFSHCEVVYDSAFPNAPFGGTPGSNSSTQCLSDFMIGADLSLRNCATVSSGSVSPRSACCSRSIVICCSTKYTLRKWSSIATWARLRLEGSSLTFFALIEYARQCCKTKGGNPSVSLHYPHLSGYSKTVGPSKAPGVCGTFAVAPG